MQADGLNKGAVEREPLQTAVRDGLWEIGHAVRISPSQMPDAKHNQGQPELRDPCKKHETTHGREGPKGSGFTVGAGKEDWCRGSLPKLGSGAHGSSTDYVVHLPYLSDDCDHYSCHDLCWTGDSDMTTTTDSWIMTRNPWTADHDMHDSLVTTTSEPNMQAATEFQLSLTLDVSIDKRDRMQVSLANQTGFYAAYRNDEHLCDGFSASFDRQRARALTFVSEAFEHRTNEDGGWVIDRKLQDDASASSAFTDDFQSAGCSHGTVIERFRRWCTMLRRVTLERSSNWTLGLIVLMSGVMLVSVCHMQQQPFRPHPMQHGFRTHVHQSDAGPPFVGTATLKCPPSGCVERNRVYTLRAWISDLMLWASAAELDPARHGPIAALQVQGSAEGNSPPQQLQHGDIDPATGQQLTGLMLLVTVLARRYAPLEAENTTSIAEFLSFRRQPGETIDSLLVRFGILRRIVPALL
eukprot:s366_g28.t1